MAQGRNDMAQDALDAQTTRTALVAVGPSASALSGRRRHPQAAFVTHLIAATLGVEDHRARRRQCPREAGRRYGQCAGQRHATGTVRATKQFDRVA